MIRSIKTKSYAAGQAVNRIPLKSIAVAFMALLWLPAAAFAEDITGSIQARYKAMKSMEAAFSQTLRHKESGSTESRSGTFHFLAPDRIRWDTKTPAPELLVINPDAVWNYFVDEEVVYKYPASLVHETKTALRFITGQANLKEEFYVEEAAPQDGLTVLHLFAKEPTTDLTEATMWIAADHSVQRILTVDFYGNENEIHFSGMRFNTGPAASLFEFTPPAGVDVEDRTQDVQEKKIGE